MASSARLDELRKKFDENPRRYFAPLANEYRKAGETDQAIAICREFLPQQPGHMSGHIVFGQALYEARQFEEAKTVFETALSLDPENLIALRHLGDISLILGDTEAARTWYRRVLDADPRNEEIQGQLASLDKAASTAPTPAVSPAQAPAEPPPAVAAKPAAARPTPGSAPTVVVQAMKPPAPAAPAPITATSPTAEVRLDEILPQAAPTPDPMARGAQSLSAVPTLEVTTSAVPHEPAHPTAAHAPVEGLESHAAAHEAPPLDSFSLEGLETTSLSHAAPPPAVPEVDLALGQAAAPEPVAAERVEEPPPPAAAADELQPLDLDFGSVTPPAAQPEEPARADAPDLVFITPEESAPTPAASLPDVAAAMGTDTVPPPVLEFEAPAAMPAEPAVVAATPPEIGYQEPAPESAPPESATPAEAAPFVTETMAELYLRQGHRDEALRVYHALIEQRPDDRALREKVRRIEEAAESSMVVPAAAGGGRFGDVLRMLAERRPGHRPQAVSTNGTAAAGAERADGPAVDVVTEGVPDGEPAPAPSAVPVVAAFAASSRADLLATALGFGPASEADEQSAHVVATAFAANGSAGRIAGAPARPAASELSLDSVFGSGQNAPPPPPSSFSFDQFFANKEAATGAQAGTGPESDAEVAQFTQWLEGLKRR